MLSWRVSLELSTLFWCHVNMLFEWVHFNQNELPHTKHPAAEALEQGDMSVSGSVFASEPSFPWLLCMWWCNITMKRVREKCWKHNFLTLSFRIPSDQTTGRRLYWLRNSEFSSHSQGLCYFFAKGITGIKFVFNHVYSLEDIFLPCSILLLTEVVLVCQPGTSFGFQALNVDRTITG